MVNSKPTFSEIAAVDLGSNSFRLQLAKVVDGHLIFHDSLREVVRLGAGLSDDKTLSKEAQQRAIACLERFGERLRGLPAPAVRAVATNTFRVAKNAPDLLKKAQEALGFPIEIIAGREEARMIFVGVSHSLPRATHKRLVIDIGGGSTEFIVGEGLEPLKMESLYMGCVSYSMRYFPEGKITESAFNKAQLAAATEIQSISKNFKADCWQEAVGSSGTARTLGEILRLNNLSDGAVTKDGLYQLRALLIKAKDTKKIPLTGLSVDRAAVIPGGLAIMLAAFEGLNIERLTVANSALREGVLYELLGRMQHDDTRVNTVNSFMRRYHVDRDQVKRVQSLALVLLSQVGHKLSMDLAVAKQYLVWAAKLHEIGISIAHSGYHKHSAYIIENADMPGFSKMEQETLGFLVRAQRRSLAKLAMPALSDDRCVLVMIFRLAVLFHRNRLDIAAPELNLAWHKAGFGLDVDQKWLAKNPLTNAELVSEVDFWTDIDISLSLA
ncbi:MAG: exopolyphosphatase [Methylophilaceae bacterium]|nr:exopolyphosphatase [Methylophilaceae bacterium]